MIDDGAMQLTLQTRTAYEVKTAAGNRVVGVIRNQGLSATKNQSMTLAYGWRSGWAEFGAVDCALATDDALVPEPDLEKAKAELEKLKPLMDSSKFDGTELTQGDSIDAAMKKRCTGEPS